MGKCVQEKITEHGIKSASKQEAEDSDSSDEEETQIGRNGRDRTVQSKCVQEKITEIRKNVEDESSDSTETESDREGSDACATDQGKQNHDKIDQVEADGNKCRTELKAHAEGAPKHSLATAIWKSALIPKSIRRPWDVFVEHFAKEANDLDRVSVSSPSEPHKAYFAFLSQAIDVRQCCAEASLAELAAYADWKRATFTTSSIPETHFQEWERVEDKASWVPTDYRTLLAEDPIWKTL